MTKNSETCFSTICRETLEPLLSQYGFTFVATHRRPRGIVVEFSKASNWLFAVCEGNVLYVDLILRQIDEQYFRVSLNQALWFNDIRSLRGLNSCDAQLRAFVRELTATDCCRQLLTDERPEMDDRYCFPMTASDSQQYLSIERAE